MQKRIVHAQTLNKTHCIHYLFNQLPKCYQVTLFRLRLFPILKNQVKIIFAGSILFHKVKFTNIGVSFLDIQHEVINARILMVLVRTDDFSDENLILKAFD